MHESRATVSYDNRVCPAALCRVYHVHDLHDLTDSDAQATHNKTMCIGCIREGGRLAGYSPYNHC
eukprot:214626-Amphidinium_carterae.1